MTVDAPLITIQHTTSYVCGMLSLLDPIQIQLSNFVASIYVHAPHDQTAPQDHHLRTFMKEFRQPTTREPCCAECGATEQEIMSGGAPDHTEHRKAASMDTPGHGGAILLALGRQLDAHLSSLEQFQGATETLTLHCTNMVLEIANLLEVIHQYKVSHAQVLADAELLRRIIGDFALFVHAKGFASN
ncbi:hypothetical protein M758_3G007000 [Ceratodon purpureus]|uniref:Uncharacterized protein n=1 Tax=Ceratodon purpureus TaxID=3225 RepID=A0A8T0IFY0_CERPU|nr:hypothetical protein KC19_3G009200 [Ceratodon purpureus]KAG0621274.1 hypothetical protein M758_3G007000 [Ceratodon purpureus]